MRAQVGAAGYGSGRVGYWLADYVEGLAVSVEIGFVSGRSNLTCRVTDAAGTAYALRRLPTRGC
jgi:hypothetical protein